MKYNKGFTLIELLVVIAIIGILSSIVLASLNQTRSKAADVKVKEQLANLRSSAANFYDSNNQSYGTAADCTEGMFIDSASGVGALVVSSNYPPGTQIFCEAAPDSFAVTASLASSTWWCVDSAGASREATSSAFVAGPLCQ